MLESITVAVVTAVAVTAIAEGVRAIHRAVDKRRRIAGWSLRGYPPPEGLTSRFFLIENAGDADALDVHVTISGDSHFEVNAGAELDLVRPRDTFLVLVHTPGSGSVNLIWTDRQGKSHTVRRAMLPE